MPRHINRMLNFGGTRVELGVQTTRQSILENLNRGHSIDQTIDAFRFAKDSGLKINAHMMPNLPGSTPKQDVEDLINLFENKDFRPDMLKIYPTLVIKGTELYNMWSKGEYKSYSLEQTIDLIAQIKSRLPSYVRIQRIQRDIPAYLIEDGVKKSNLRELVKQHLAQNNKKCNCIRCREQGFLRRTLLQKEENAYLDFESFKLKRLDYEASKGTEIFLSYENDDMLVGYLRLRKPSIDVFRPELRYPDVLIVREIKVVGDVVPHKKRPSSQQVQHRGFGQRLLKKAELLAKNEFDAKKIAVISGIGVREWFYNFSYKIDGYYVSKRLD
jgi:elongator complex protein 3